MGAFYRELDVLVVPSRTRHNWKEQFGRVIIEAMACCVPVIGSDSGAIPGVIGDGGLIFPEDDSAALSDCLQTLMHDEGLRCQLAEKGRARVLENYTHAQVAAHTVAVYRAMLGGH
jgi:glycosyltransferase involved in cell wall biosynthesis